MAEGALGDLGPCVLDYKGSELGRTFGGVIFRSTPEDVEVKEDQVGIDAVDKIFVGRVVTVEAMLTRMQLAELSAIMPGSTMSSGVAVVKSNVGSKQYANSGILILKPVVDGVTSVTPGEWITMPKAFPKEDYEIQYDNENQRVYKVTFYAFKDQVTGIHYKMGA